MNFAPKLGIAILWAALCVPAVFAQATGESVRLIVPSTAGGPLDAAARAFGEGLGRILGQPFVVENRAGANSIIGASACKAAAPDGTTFCVFLNDTVTINPSLYSKLPYDADKDFVPVAAMTGIEAAIVVQHDLPVSNLRELAEYDAARPRTLSWGSFGAGSSSHLYLGQFNRRLKAQINHIPYNGGSVVVNALVAGDIHASMLSYGLVNQWIQKGKLKPIAVVGESRSPFFQGVATATEQGVPMGAKAWIGMFAPAGTSQQAVDRMNAAVNRLLRDPAFLKQLEPQGLTPLPGTPKDLSERVRKDRGVWSALAQAADVKLD